MVVNLKYYLCYRQQSLQEHYNIFAINQQMSINQSDLSSDSPRTYNRSCNEKIQNDSITSGLPQGFKMRNTRSQNLLDSVEGAKEMQAIEKKWQQNQGNKPKKGNLVGIQLDEHQFAPTKIRTNDKKMKSATKRGLQFGASMVNSQEISVYDDFGDEPNSPKRQKKQKINNLMKAGDEIKIQEQPIKHQNIKTIRLNIMLLGKSGIGKTSFIDSFCNKKYENAPVSRQKTQVIGLYPFIHQQGNIQTYLSLIDIPGYRQTKAQEYTNQVKHMIIDKIQKHLDQEQDKKNNIKREQDDRIHCCLFFLSGPWINDFDWSIMKSLEGITNIIPIIAKGDTFTTNQLRQFKKKIDSKRKIEHINWFSIEQIIRQNNPQKLSNLLEGAFGRSPPFVITCCTQKIYNQQNRTYQLVRNYRWGKCQLQNQAHNDFKFLRQLLVFYLSQTLIKATDILQRSYLEKQIENHNRVMSQSNSDQIIGMHDSISSSHTEAVHNNDFWSIVHDFVPIGLTVMGVIAIIYVLRKKQT